MLEQAYPVLEQGQDVHALDDAVQREGRVCMLHHTVKGWIAAD